MLGPDLRRPPKLPAALFNHQPSSPGHYGTTSLFGLRAQMGQKRAACGAPLYLEARPIPGLIMDTLSVQRQWLDGSIKLIRR